MGGSREHRRVPGWAWVALVVILAAVPMVLSVSVPLPAKRTAVQDTPKSTAPPATLAPNDLTPETATAPAPEGDPDLGVTRPRTPRDVEYDALESEMATLRIEKAAIEAEEQRIRGKREEIEQFERDHPNGVPPELYSRYEDDRARYNSDVQAFKSRASVYTMKVAEVERRIEALGPSAP